MFNLIQATSKYKQLQIDKVKGLSPKPKQYNPIVEHIDGDIYDTQAESEAKAISKAYKSATIDFGKRISKKHGEKHLRRGIGQMQTVKHNANL